MACLLRQDLFANPLPQLPQDTRFWPRWTALTCCLRQLLVPNVTDVAGGGLLPQVDDVRVHLEGAPLRKVLLTDVAVSQLLPEVNGIDVPLEVMLARKLLLADVAYIALHSLPMVDSIGVAPEIGL